ncbi:MAG: replication initiator protein [Microviridae sp.]|nr:MAG: replication initiator protein [Microviridae sp.]
MTVNDKVQYKVTSYQTNHVELINNIWTPTHLSFRSSLATKVVSEYIEIPCGKCLGCKLDYSSRWADRCLLEMQYHSVSCFLTLTYDDEHVPYNDNGLMTLRFTDFQKFMKRLRKCISPVKVRYFACSEYGSKSLRPHYHVIIFGWEPPDKEIIRKGPAGSWYYKSCLLERLWPFGYSLVGDATWKSCAYVARYVTKKLGSHAELEDYDLEPERIVMSRKPGLAYQWFHDHPEFVEWNSIPVTLGEDGGKSIRPPKYFEAKLEEINPELAKQRRLARQEMAKAHKMDYAHFSTQQYLDYLKSREYNLSRRTAALRREL